MEFIQAILIVLLYSIACFSFGLRLLYLLGFRRENDSTLTSSFAVIGSSFLLGQGIFAGILQLVVVLGMFKVWLVLPLLIIAFASGANLLWHYIQQLPGAITLLYRHWREAPYTGKIIISGAFLSVVVTAIFAALPNITVDGLAFYMSFPRMAALTGQYTPPPGYYSFAQVGLQGEFHYAVLILFSGISAATLFAWVTGLGGVSIFVAIGDEVGIKKQARWIIPIALFTSSAFTFDMVSGKIDTFGAVMGLAAYYWALQISHDHNDKRLALRLTGLFTGLAIIAKISYLLILPPSIGLLIIWRYQAVNEDSILQTLHLKALTGIALTVGAWALLAAVSHIIKNSVIYHEPFAPILVFNPDNASILDQTWFSQSTTKHILLSYPFSLTFGRFWAQAGQLSPIGLAFAPLIFLIKTPRPLMRNPLVQLSTVALISIIIWVVLRPSIFAPRYILPPLLLLFLVPLYAADSILASHKFKGLQSLLLASLILVVIVSADYIKLEHRVSNIVQGKTSCDFDPECQKVKDLEQADLGDRVFLATYYTLWLRPDTVQCHSMESEMYDVYTGTVDKIWNYMYQRNFGYIFINKITHNTIQENLNAAMVPDWMVVQTIYDDRDYSLYKINTINPPDEPLVTCVETSPSVWEIRESAN